MKTRNDQVDKRRQAQESRLIVPIERLRECFNYDPETGAITNRIYRGGRGPAGKEIPATASGGHKYRRTQCDGVRILCHRIAWALHYGYWPEQSIDHINGDGFDNRISNLRLATRSQNGRNRGKNANNTSGFKGVSWHSVARKWRAATRINGRRIHIGSFDSAEEAGAAYDRLAREEHGEFYFSDK